MSDREMYWSGRQSDAALRRAMAGELSALCEAMGWDYDLVDEPGICAGWPGEGRRQGVVIYPDGASSRKAGKEASFAFLLGEEVHPNVRHTIASRPCGEPPDPGARAATFHGGGFWWLADPGLVALCAFVKRLWVPGLTWLACGGTRLPPAIGSWLLGSGEEVLEAFRSADLRKFLAQHQMKPEGRRLRLRNDLRVDAEAWFHLRHPPFPELEAALDRKFPGCPWREASLTVLPFRSDVDLHTLRRAGYGTLGDLVLEGRKPLPTWEHHDRMPWADYQLLKRSFLQTAESLHYLGAASTPVSADDLAPHLPPPPDPGRSPGRPHPACTVMEALDPELLELKQELIHALQANPPETLGEFYLHLGGLTRQRGLRVALWPHLLAVAFAGERIGLIPFGDLLAPMDRFRRGFEVAVDAFAGDTEDYLDALEPECPYRDQWLGAPVERVPEADRGRELQDMLRVLLETLADPHASCRLDQPRLVSAWLQGSPGGVLPRRRANLPWRYWRGYLVQRPWGGFRLADWTLLRELAAFCSDHLGAPVPDLLALRRDFHTEALQQILGLPDRLTATDVIQRAADVPTWPDRISEVVPDRISDADPDWHATVLLEGLQAALSEIEAFLGQVKASMEPGLTLRGLKHHVLGGPGWTPWWPLAQTIWGRPDGTCAGCTHLGRLRGGEAACRLTTRLLADPEETFCLAHSAPARSVSLSWGLPPLFRMVPGGRTGFVEVEPGGPTSPEFWQEAPPPPTRTDPAPDLGDDL